MDGGGLSCPVEECKDNRGGFCGIRQALPLGFAPSGFFPANNTNFLAPFGPAMSLLKNSAQAEAQPPMTDDWGMWRNCPRISERGKPPPDTSPR